MNWLTYAGLAVSTAAGYYLIGKYGRQLFDRLQRPRTENGGR